MNKAQSILEYLITITVIVAAIIAASGSFGGKVRQGTQDAVGSIDGLLSENPVISGGN